VNASKERYGKSELRALFDGASKVIVAKGKKVITLDLAKDPPGLAELAALALGPTGNLRAPALRTGKTWLIGFHQDTFAERFR